MATTQEVFKVLFGADDQLSAKMAGIAKGAAAVAIAFKAAGAIKDFFVESVAAAAESERAFNELAASVERRGGSWDIAGEHVRAFASLVQDETGFSDEAVARSVQSFLDFGASGQQAFDRTRAAANLARGAHLDLESATNLLAKASAGATQMLGRYGIIVDENLSKSEKFEAALKLINERWKDAAGVESYAKQVAILNQNLDDMKENIGNQVLPALNSLARGVNDAFIVLNSNVSVWTKMQIAAGFFTGDIKKLAEAEAQLAAVAAFVRVKLKEQAASTEGLPQTSRNAGDAIAKLTDEEKKFIRELEHLKRSGLTLVPRVDNSDVEAYARAMQRAREILNPPKKKPDEDIIRNMFKAEFEQDQIWLDQAQARYQDFQSFATGATGQLTTQIAGMFVGLRGDLAVTFKGIARDFISMVLNQILAATAAKLGVALLNLIFPGTGAGLALIGGVTGAGAAGKRSPGTGQNLGPASVQVNIQTVIGEERFVNETLVPAIQRGVIYGTNKLALQGI